MDLNKLHELTAAALAENPNVEFECVCCGRKIYAAKTVRWVELGLDGGYYRYPSKLSAERSQGCFPMGAGCFRTNKPK
jgi:hypothetical protein